MTHNRNILNSAALNDGCTNINNHVPSMPNKKDLTAESPEVAITSAFVHSTTSLENETHPQTFNCNTTTISYLSESERSNNKELENSDTEYSQQHKTKESTKLKFKKSTNKYSSVSIETHGRYRHTLTPDADNVRPSGLQNSTTNSLSSIISTSESAIGIGGGGGCNGSGDFDGSQDLQNNKNDNLTLSPVIKQEKWTTVLLQVSIPFFLAGIGTIAAGIILGRVKKRRVFICVTELFILVPALLGLKGNLDMCLASRLSTQANLGNMTGDKKEVMQMILGNIALVQVQATVASFLVAMFAAAVGGAIDGNFLFEDVMLLTASAMFTATSSCFVLDFVLIAVILLCQKFRLNPDNLATPLAASIGDVVSISLLSSIASILFNNIKTHLWITYVAVACYMFLLPMWVAIVLKNKYTRPVLKSGWVPVLSALCISGLGGLILNTAGAIDGFVVFQPIINGIGGNLVSVQASKISTMLHQTSVFGIVPPHTKIFEWPWIALLKGVPYAKTARLLISLSIPGNILFIFVADYIHMSKMTINVAFVFSYLIASLIQLILLLYIAHIIVHAMWKWKIDPDNSSIPYLTSLGDLLGSAFLALAFLFLLSINKKYGSGIDNSTLDKQCL